MNIRNYSKVKLLTDNYVNDGVHIGDTGYVVEVYEGKGYEVEFMDEQGNTINSFGVHLDEVEAVEEKERNTAN